MTFDEAKQKAQMLTKLNIDLWSAKTPHAKDEIRCMFKSCWNDLRDAGFRVLKHKVYDDKFGYKIPRYHIREDNSESLVTIIDNRNGEHHAGDCTTRCISFLTGIDYATIRNEQLKLLKLKHASQCNYWMTWRHEKVWSECLTSRGWCKLVLPRKVARKTFIKMFANCGLNDGVIGTLSSNHIAAIDMKNMKILDTWNSAGGRIISIYVPVSKKDAWASKLNMILG